MEKNLPSRPHLDHLRRQAKSLLAALGDGDAAAAKTFQEFLPAAAGMTAKQVRQAGFHLADAQSAIARKTGFASWPQLSRHVEQLRALEGTWSFVSLEVDGNNIPAVALQSSKILMDGDCFRSESPGAVYEGTFNIDVEAEPHQIDIAFVAGPEAGNTNYGIFRLDGDQLEICLDVNGKARPSGFHTTPGSGHAYETLRRTSGSRPESVTGGIAAPTKKEKAVPKNSAAIADSKALLAAAESAGFGYTPSHTLTRMQGEWTAVKLVRDGFELPAEFLCSGKRTAKNHEVIVTFGGQQVTHALARVNDQASPVEIDYFNLSGPAEGMTQLGILEWKGDVVCICMAPPCHDRPAEFTCEPGSGRILSHWRLKAQ